MKNTVISAADILLPPYSADDKSWGAYAVIACDQFTSEPDYWENAQKIVGDKLSTLGLVLPEAFLETEKEEGHKALVAENMRSIEEKLVLHKNCLIYVERTLPDGRVRRGLVGKLDLHEYDFSPDSSSAVRATEETVISRIPPRVAVRSKACIELPHVMVFANDEKKQLIESLCEKVSEDDLIYSFDLMLGGGSIRAYKIEGELLCDTQKKIFEYESSVTDGLIYAMGDGNHSLASAKAHYENIKKEWPEAAEDHPARYALVEVVNLYDDAIEFEPIYRILTNCDPDDFFGYVESRMQESAQMRTVVAVIGDTEKNIEIPALHALTVGSLQILIDDYLKINPFVACDYIHGVESLKTLSKEKGTVGFLFEGVEKNELFSYVADNGTLPRKTFSMGEAVSKRYYIEARKITK
ncbi:MAG: DUF1015 domain-containing protein [Clostridia bacterium]|nr:DUF1015 domain-containing protein [Clostridia bacterium]